MKKKLGKDVKSINTYINLHKVSLDFETNTKLFEVTLTKHCVIFAAVVAGGCPFTHLLVVTGEEAGVGERRAELLVASVRSPCTCGGRSASHVLRP